MCNIKPKKIDYYVPETLNFQDFEVDQTIITRIDYLKKLSFNTPKKDEEVCDPCDELYAYVNSYYCYTEDQDPLNKVNSLLAQIDILETCKAKEAEKCVYLEDAFSEKEAQIRYLESQPVSFIILGKPDIGQEELGKELASFWGCLYIEPQTLVEEEIESGSRAGQCIEFNLRSGRAIEIDIILKLVEQKVKSEVANHRGFVLCGLPVIPNDLYEEDPVSSQSAIFTAQDIFEDVFAVTTNICMAPSNPNVSMSSKYGDIEESSDKGCINEPMDPEMDLGQHSSLVHEELHIGKNYEKQLDFLFKCLKEPYFIIYIQSTATDVLKKRSQYRFNIYSNQLIDMQRRMYDQVFNTRLIHENDCSFNEHIHDFNALDIENFRLQHLVHLPSDFVASVSSQLDQYHQVALNFIQNRILAHSPEYFIKVDGRTCVKKMLSLIKARLNVMNIQKVIVPLKLNDDIDKSNVTLMLEDNQSETGKPINVEECFKQINMNQVISRFYPWSWSEWGSKCPVSMKAGFLQEGSVKYPVQFMNKLYFLANEESYWKFYCNPRPYLLPPFPRCTCRIFIFGPRRSGKTALAHCLAYYLGGSVLSTDTLLSEFKQQRQEEYLEKIRQQALAEGITKLNEIRAMETETLEMSRIEKIKEWVKAVVEILEEMSALLTEIENQEQRENFEISSFPMAMKKETKEAVDDSEYAVTLMKLREQLSDLQFPIYKLDVKTWKSFITQRKKLLQYLPQDLVQKHQAKPATLFDDFVKDYVEDSLAKAGFDEVQLSGGGILDMFINHMHNAEQKYRKQGYGRGGWIVDGMMCNLKILQDFFPDYTGDDLIVLNDSNNFLVQNFENRHTTTFFRDFKKFFIDVGLLDAALRSPSVISTDEYKVGLAKNILTDILDSEPFFAQPDTAEEYNVNVNHRVEEYKKDLNSFKHEWSKVNEFYLKNNITPIEIDVSGKTLTDIFKKTIKALDAKYTYSASRFQEPLDEKEENTEEAEDVSAMGTSTAAQTLTETTSSSKYGETFHFCPITLTENFVLWKGKVEFAAKFNNKTYLLATEEDLNKFLDEPMKYIPTGYFAKLPPPRICLIGVSRSGKTHLSKSLCDNYGLIYLSFENFLKECYDINSQETLNDLVTTSTISELRNYLNGMSPLPDKVVTQLKSFWFKEPFKSRGFVFDGYPRNPSDIDLMVEKKLIPDIVLYPQASDTYLKTKFLERSLKRWQEGVDKRLQELISKRNRDLRNWREKRNIRFNNLIEQKRETRYAKRLHSKSQAGKYEDTVEADTTSQVSFDSVADQEDIDEINRILDLEFLPPLAFIPPAEKPDSFIAKAEPLILKDIQMDLTKIHEIKDKCIKNQIVFEEIPLNLEQINKTEISSYLVVSPIKFRNLSFLESCYEISLEIAEKLLNSGYIFLSKFGRICPVQYYENQIPIQRYQIAVRDNMLFPIIHRNYVYFLVGEKQKNLFKKDPLRYINKEFKMPLLSYRLGVTGPPKCGKTTLSRKIQNQYGFKLISRGEAVRYVLKYLFDSDLAKNMESVLRKGWELTDEMVIRSVEAASFDILAITQGLIFDGFPNNLNEVRHLAYVDLVPNITIDLQASHSEVLHCLALATPPKNFRKFSPKFITHLYEEWLKDANFFREWFDKQYQAMVKFPIGTCSWPVWYQSQNYLLSTFSEINHYHNHIRDDWPLRLGNMLVTPLEFLDRQSSFKTFCPVCLHFSNTLINGGEPPDRSGVVQYKSYFYWICPAHIELFLKTPEKYLPPYNSHGMPVCIPKRTILNNYSENLYEDGACAICYKENRIITKGKLELAVLFNDKTYLFDSTECLDTFLKNPSLYTFEIKFHAPVYPNLTYKELPILGMLEQYVAKYLVAGISFISRRRPVIPGLSISTSALVGLGLFIKVKNERPNPLKSYYKEGLRLFNERHDNLLKFLDFMKSYRNPYLYYEETLPIFQLPPLTPKTESATTMVSRIVDQCVDNIDIYLNVVENTSDTHSDL
ncbi:hypothetical protein ABEB36_008970 [Hypothenemus hampei]|uniref:Nucleoside-diphosphate kinase n=1 Tax=Hypothenemus hampei TaxID=57062 RepID=A0ABD1EPC2_HYPHA